MESLKFNWLPKDYEIVENEMDFVFIKYKGIPQSVYLQTNPKVTEEFLKREVRNLERLLQESKLLETNNFIG
jgi:hypothetical protein